LAARLSTPHPADARLIAFDRSRASGSRSNVGDGAFFCRTRYSLNPPTFAIAAGIDADDPDMFRNRELFAGLIANLKREDGKRLGSSAPSPRCSLPASELRMRSMIMAGSSSNRWAGRYSPAVGRRAVQFRHQRIAKPDMTLLTTISVATPSITLTMQTDAGTAFADT